MWTGTFQAFEEAIYVLEGTIQIEVAGGVEELSADDYCFIEKGVPHRLANAGGETVRWLELCAPQPGSEMIEDTVFLAAEPAIALPELAFRRAHFDASALPPPSSAIGLAGFGAANVGGASLEILIKDEFGASQFNLMVVEYGPGGFITEHDHAFEEGFFFLTGEIEAVLDGSTYTLQAGDYCWSGVQSPHALANRTAEPVRWLETQAPQPPSRHQARFTADWERLRARDRRLGLVGLPASSRASRQQTRNIGRLRLYVTLGACGHSWTHVVSFSFDRRAPGRVLRRREPCRS